MKHIIYKTTHPNGKYYIGRHSTEDLNDGYIGSGRWTSQIKDKSVLTRIILCEVPTFDELTILEEQYIKDHIDDPQCMNMSNSSTGAPIGDLNPMRDPEIAAKISGDNHWTVSNPDNIPTGEDHWMNTNPNAKRQFIENHPMKTPENREQMRKQMVERNQKENPATKLAREGKHHWQQGKAPNAGGKQNKRLIEAGTHNLLGPDHNKKMIAEGKNAWVGSTQNEKMLAAGTHPSQQKKICEHCGKESSKGMYVRWHGDKCKTAEENLRKSDKL